MDIAFGKVVFMGSTRLASTTARDVGFQTVGDFFQHWARVEGLYEFGAQRVLQLLEFNFLLSQALLAK